VIEAEQHAAEIDRQHLRAIAIHCSTVAAGNRSSAGLSQAARPGINRLGRARTFAVAT
jgi:hypothetical protein